MAIAGVGGLGGPAKSTRSYHLPKALFLYYS